MGEEIRYISLFSGVEACSVAWHHMDNWTPKVFAEFDEFPSAVLKYQFPNVPNVGDVTKHEWKQYKGQIELIVGGSPCQSFSVAGQRLGLDDPRGNLALHFLRVIEDVQPTWFIFENVAGLLSSDNGRDFAAFLAEVENIGYGCAYRVLDAQYFGVPQRRRRLFVVGHIDGDWRRAAAVLFEPEGLSGNPPSRSKKGQEATPSVGNSVGGSSGGRGVSEYLDKKPAGALTTEIYHKGGYGNQSVDTHGTLIPCGVDLFNQEETGEVHAALRTATGHGAPAVMTAKVYENHGQDSRVKEVQVSPTIPARAGTGGNNLPIVTQQKENICFDHTFGQNAVVYEGVSPTLKANGLVPTSPAVAQEPIPIHDKATRWKGGGDTRKNDGAGNGFGVGKPGDPFSTLTKNDRHAVFNHDLIVRRLTPVECERLQGFPDNWTQIPWKGKPKEKCPDGPRFKTMGNSMAVPVMRWIGEGVELVNRIPRTEAPQQEELGWL